MKTIKCNDKKWANWLKKLAKLYYSQTVLPAKALLSLLVSSTKFKFRDKTDKRNNALITATIGNQKRRNIPQ